MKALPYLLACLVFIPSISFSQVVERQFFTNGVYLNIEILDDDLMHFEYSSQLIQFPIYRSPMVFKTDYIGPNSLTDNGNELITDELKLEVNGVNLCVSLSQKESGTYKYLTTLCPAQMNQDWKGLNIDPAAIQNIYGLGQHFKKLKEADGDWLNHGTRTSQPHGNGFIGFGQAGMVGNIQIPVMYALGDNNLQYALFIDNVYKREWAFDVNWWQVRMWGDQIRFYFMSGQDLPDLRQDYMELTGTPPVPPRKSFGLWVSEFGYKDWQEVHDLKNSLRLNNFPLDGFVLDLFWFGGIKANDPYSPMGRLEWDEDGNDGNDYFFGNPDTEISNLNNDHIGLVAIEESYFNLETNTYQQMQVAGDYFSYKQSNGQCVPSAYDPVVLSEWFGKAAMMDWSDTQGAKWIHDNRRYPNLVQKGITNHWTDLGEPEKYDQYSCYDGVETTASGLKNQHGDIHNLYNFLWSESIYNGYVDKNPQVDSRPFIVTRSGASGIQRYSAALWSGDIGANLDLLATHSNAQMHMSFSGIDYYGADVGGFRREAMPYNENHSGQRQYEDELFTQWFANAAWFDVPVRPHTDNAFQTSQNYETAPDKVGELASNLANIRRRYELIPYYYSLAHRAFLYGEPVVPPLVYYYQNDPLVRIMGHQKLIGKDLMIALVAKHGEYKRNVYMPAGEWFDWHSNEWFNSSGEWVDNVPVYREGLLTLPAYAKAGAIIPMMTVTAATKDSFGNLKPGGRESDLKARVYLSQNATSFDVYEDDGTTLTFNANNRPEYDTQITNIAQELNVNNIGEITINASVGSYSGAPAYRNNILEVISNGMEANEVKLNTLQLPERQSLADFELHNTGWYNADNTLVLIKTGSLPTSVKKDLEVHFQPGSSVSSVNFVCDKGWTSVGEDIYVTGNKAKLGNWNPDLGVKLSPSIYKEYIYNPPANHNGPGPKDPVWTEHINGLPVNTSIEWKCVKRKIDGSYEWEPGSNNSITTSPQGYSGMSYGSF